jgi:hypothetical protein
MQPPAALLQPSGQRALDESCWRERPVVSAAKEADGGVKSQRQKQSQLSEQGNLAVNVNEFFFLALKGAEASPLRAPQV